MTHTPDTIRAERPLGGEGGDVRFSTGRGAPGHPSGSFVFEIPSEDGGMREVLRIDPDGGFYCEGRPVAQDHLVYQAFRHWLAQAQGALGRGCTYHPEGPKATTCSTCGKPLRPGVTRMFDDAGGYRHVVGSPECDAPRL